MPKPILTKVAQKERLFILAFLTNGGNATQAAIEAGYASRSADVTGSRLLGKPRVASQIAARSTKALQQAEITVERTLRENAAIAHIDPRRLYREDGTPKPPSEWPDDIAAAISSVKSREDLNEKGARIGITYEVRFWDKGAALERLFKYQKLYADLPPPINVTQNILNVNVERMETEDVEDLYRLATEALSPAVGGTEEDG